MARKRTRQRLSWLSSAWATFAGRINRRAARMRLWFERHARDNLILAVLATIGATLARPFRHFRKRTRRAAFGALAVGVAILLAIALLSDRGGPGAQLVRAAEPPTTAANESATSTLPALAPATPRDTTPPPLLLDPGLTDGLKVGANHIVVSGMSDPGAKVVVAGIELTADDAGGWAADVPLGLGPNVIDIVSTDSAGNATGAAFTVVYEVDAPPPPPSKAPRPAVVTTTSIAPTTTSVVTTAARKAAMASPSTTLATTTTGTALATTPVTDEHGHVLFPTTAAGATTTRATTTTTHLTTTTTEPTTTTTESTTMTTTTTEPSTTTTAEDTTVPLTDPPSTDPPAG